MLFKELHVHMRAHTQSPHRNQKNTQHPHYSGVRKAHRCGFTAAVKSEQLQWIKL